MQNTGTQKDEEKGHVTNKCSFSAVQDLAHMSTLTNTMYVLDASMVFFVL